MQGSNCIVQIRSVANLHVAKTCVLNVLCEKRSNIIFTVSFNKLFNTINKAWKTHICNNQFVEGHFINGSTMWIISNWISYFSPFFWFEIWEEKKVGTCAPQRRFEGASLPASELPLQRIATATPLKSALQRPVITLKPAQQLCILSVRVAVKLSSFFLCLTECQTSDAGIVVLADVVEETTPYSERVSEL